MDTNTAIICETHTCQNAAVAHVCWLFAVGITAHCQACIDEILRDDARYVSKRLDPL